MSEGLAICGQVGANTDRIRYGMKEGEPQCWREGK